MKYVGIIGILLFLLWGSGTYLGFRRQKLAESEALRQWAEQLCRSAERGERITEILPESLPSESILEKNGFARNLRATGSAVRSLSETPFALNAEELRPLTEAAVDLGKGSRAEECERLKRCVQALRENGEKLRERTEKDARLIRTLTASVSAGILILFL